jgi:hypothetical protein
MTARVRNGALRPRTARRLVRAGAVTSATCIVVGVGLHSVTIAEAGFLLPVAIPFAAVGGLLAYKLPSNPIGWLFLAFGVSASAAFAASQYAYRALSEGSSLPGGDLAATLGTHMWHPSFGLFVFAFLLFPNGRLLTPRWRWMARVTVVTYGGLALSGPFDTDYLKSDGIAGAEPLFHGTVAEVGSAVFGILLAFNLLLLAISALSLLLRLKRSHGEERQQVKVFVYTVACVMLFFPISVLVVGNGGVGVMLFPLIPVSAAIAVLKYRLYDIDVVINRTLVYGALTATLAGVYLGSVLVLELALSGVTEGSGLAVAGSTLGVAALFRPARARIQEAVDRRFYRHKYDAQRTLQAFSARLRDEVHLEALNSELSAVVRETLQPAHVSLWLRGAGQ